MKNKIKKLMTKTKVVITTVWLQMMVPVMVLADEPALVSGTKKLISDVTGYAMGMIVGITVLAALIIGIMWLIASEEEKPKHKKRFITTIVIGVVLLTISGTINWVMGYYQPTA